MEAVRLYAIGDLRHETVAAPAAPAPDEVTLAVSVAGICGSDLHNYRTGAWISRAPSVAGHEFAGTVTANGESVSHVAVGDRVIVDSRYTCGQCQACQDGVGQACTDLGFLGEVIDGGFAEQVTLPGRNVLKAPEGVAHKYLAMAEPLAVALHALNLMHVPKGAEIVITGCGPIGGLITLLATRAGHPVRIVDRNAARTALLAEATGAKVSNLDALADHYYRYAIDTIGNAHVIKALLSTIAGASRLGLVGIGKAADIIDPVHLVEREITLVGCHAFNDELATIGEMLPDLASHLDPFIESMISLEDVPAAYDRLLAGDTTGIKTLIRIGETGGL